MRTQNLDKNCVVLDVFGGKGRHQKINCFFFRKTPKGGEGGLAESKISLSEKTEIFLEFFF